MNIIFTNNKEYYKAQSLLNKANYYRSGNGNPPGKNVSGIYTACDRWMDITINGDVEKITIILAGLNYEITQNNTCNYVIHSHGGYLD